MNIDKMTFSQIQMNTETDYNMAVYTTGATLVPAKIGDTWFWIASGINDDTYQDGEIVNVHQCAGAKKYMIIEEEENE